MELLSMYQQQLESPSFVVLLMLLGGARAGPRNRV
jgi:hypothetical protein